MSVSETTVRNVLEGLADVALLKRSGKRPTKYELNYNGIETRIDALESQKQAVQSPQ